MCIVGVTGASMQSQDLDRYDEMFWPDGTVRPAYAEFLDWYEK